MLSPRPFAALLVAALCAVLSACTPAPAASPTPTPLYSSDAEALAAAEQTYRDYIDAYNKIDLADPATFEPVYALTTGDLRDYLKKQLTAYHAAGWTLSGGRLLALLQPHEGDAQTLYVSLDVCLGVDTIVLSDESGVSQIPADRPAKQPVLVNLTRATPESSWIVTDELQRTGDPSCV